MRDIVKASGFSLILFFCLAACSGGHSYNTSAPEVVPDRTITNFSDLLLPPLTCADAKGCLASVGELIISSANGVAYCTVTLVKPDLIITASHCRPPAELVANDKSIRGGCWVRFPAQGSVPPTQVACSRLVTVTHIDQAPGEKAHADQAMIRLASAQEGRPLMRLSDPAALAPDDLHVSVMGISITNAEHTIKRLECARSEKAVDGLNLDPLKVILLPDCPIEKGFSGGPVLKNDVEIGVNSFVHPKPFVAVAMPISSLGHSKKNAKKVNASVH